MSCGDWESRSDAEPRYSRSEALRNGKETTMNEEFTASLLKDGDVVAGSLSVVRATVRGEATLLIAGRRFSRQSVVAVRQY
jgi:hypothetical protein